MCTSCQVTKWRTPRAGCLIESRFDWRAEVWIVHRHIHALAGRMIARLCGPEVRELRSAQCHHFAVRNFLALGWTVDGRTELEAGWRQRRGDDGNQRTMLALIAK